MSNTPSPPRPRPVPSGRISRLSRMGGMTASVAGNMALNGLLQLGRGTRPAARDLLMTPGNIRRIADELAGMRGAAMKIGQLISMDADDLLPPEMAQIMARLRAEADFMPPRQLKQVLNAELSPGWLGRFAGFDPRPIAAASIGQVHRARLKDGREIALKVQYPGIARSIDSDVANVGRLIAMAGLVPPNIALAPFLDEARRQLHDEADYIKEAAHLAAFRRLLDGDARFVLPDHVPELSTPRVLAMSFVTADPIEALAEEDQEVRDRVASDLIALMLQEVFDFKRMQTDPNFANYRYQRNSGRIVLLDFGAARSISAGIADAYRALFRVGLTAAPEAEIAGPAEVLGLLHPDLEARHRETILAMLRLVFTEVTKDAVFDFATSPMMRRLHSMGEALAAERVVMPPPPMDVLYVQRKFAGMFLLAARLGARVRLGEMMASAVGVEARN